MLHSKGLTLIELMVTVAVAAILASIAAPSFDTSIKNMRVSGAADQLVTALSLARMSAVKRAGYVVVCPSTDGTSCSGTDWSVGLLITQDNATTPGAAPTFSTADTATTEDQRIKVFEAFHSDVVVTLASNSSFIRFDALGATANSTAQTFTVNHTDCADYRVRQISVSVAGHAAIETGVCP